MTVIAGYRARGGAWIGHDSACTAGDLVTLVSGKVRHMPGYSVGVSGDATMLGVLAVAKLGTGELANYADVLKKVAAPLTEAADDDADWLALAVSPHGLWYVGQSSAMEVAEAYAAVGSGAELTLAALDALQSTGPKAALDRALAIACGRSSSCSEPIYVTRVGTVK